MRIVIPIKWIVDMAGLEGEWETVGFVDRRKSKDGEIIEIVLRPSRVIVFHDPPDYKASDVVAKESPRPDTLVDTEFPEHGWKEMLDGLRRYLAW